MAATTTKWRKTCQECGKDTITAKQNKGAYCRKCKSEGLDYGSQCEVDENNNIVYDDTWWMDECIICSDPIPEMVDNNGDYCNKCFTKEKREAQDKEDAEAYDRFCGHGVREPRPTK